MHPKVPIRFTAPAGAQGCMSFPLRCTAPAGAQGCMVPPGADSMHHGGQRGVALLLHQDAALSHTARKAAQHSPDSSAPCKQLQQPISIQCKRAHPSMAASSICLLAWLDFSAMICFPGPRRPLQSCIPKLQALSALLCMHFNPSNAFGCNREQCSPLV